MEDYNEKVKELINKFFSPINATGKSVTMSTAEVLEMVRGIIPVDPINEHDVYEILSVGNFEIIRQEDVMLWVLHEL